MHATVACMSQSVDGKSELKSLMQDDERQGSESRANKEINQIRAGLRKLSMEIPKW